MPMSVRGLVGMMLLRIVLRDELAVVPYVVHGHVTVVGHAAAIEAIDGLALKATLASSGTHR